MRDEREVRETRDGRDAIPRSPEKTQKKITPVLQANRIYVVVSFSLQFAFALVKFLCDFQRAFLLSLSKAFNRLRFRYNFEKPEELEISICVLG